MSYDLSNMVMMEVSEGCVVYMLVCVDVCVGVVDRYGLDCEVLPGPMKSALFKLLEKRPKIKAVVMGTRRSDPYSGEDTIGNAG